RSADILRLEQVRNRLPGGGNRIRTRGPSSQGRRHLFADEKGRRSTGMAVNGGVYFVGDLRFGSRLGRRRVRFRRELRFAPASPRSADPCYIQIELPMANCRAALPPIMRAISGSGTLAPRR